jgi:hypothetical protein
MHRALKTLTPECEWKCGAWRKLNEPVGRVETAAKEWLSDGNAGLWKAKDRLPTALGKRCAFPTFPPHDEGLLMKSNAPIGRNPPRRISGLDLTLPSHGSDPCRDRDTNPKGEN